MKTPKRGAAAAKSPQPTFPIAQVGVAELISRMRPEQLDELLDDQTRKAMERYWQSWGEFTTTGANITSAKKRTAHLFRGCMNYTHPMFRGRWADGRASNDNDIIKPQLERALKAEDHQEVMMLAGMLCVREMLYGRATNEKAKRDTAARPTAAKAKAVRKTAPKKPAAKKPGSIPITTTAELTQLVAKAKPVFKANPNITREQLIAKIGRRYERLTTLAELRALCAGKTVTRHSLKKPKATPEAAPKESGTRAVDGSSPSPSAAAWPWPTESAPPKPKRPRRDPDPGRAVKPHRSGGGLQPPPAPSSSLPRGVAAVDWPKPDADGTYRGYVANHAAEFKSGEVEANFAVLETENGWTTGINLFMTAGNGEAIHTGRDLHINGPLAQDADTAVRDATADLLTEVKEYLKTIEEPYTDRDRFIVGHRPDLEKLRAWLLGFQVRGVEKIAFLKKSQTELELAA